MATPDDKNLTRPHHPFSPSKLSMLEACPAYEGHDTAGEAALKGTKQHGIVESGEDDHTLGDDEAAAAAECLDFFNRQHQLMVEERQRAIEYRKGIIDTPDLNLLNLPDVQVFEEIYLAVDDLEYVAPVWSEKDGKFINHSITATTGGYIDRGLLSWEGTYAELFDWKFGKWAVEDAKDNVQGISYVLGWFRKFPQCQRVKFWFKQPHLNLTSSHVFVRADIPALMMRIKTIVARKIESNKRADFSMASPMVPACNFCAQLGRCPKALELFCKVGSKFFPLEIPENITPTMALDPQNSGLALRLSGVCKVWADAFRRQTTDRVLRGGCLMPDGYTLTTKSDREVVDKVKMLDVAHRHVTDAELKEIAEYSLPKIEAIINDKAPRGQKTAAIHAFNEELKAVGALVKGEPYTFLRAVSSTRKEKTNTEDESTE